MSAQPQTRHLKHSPQSSRKIVEKDREKIYVLENMYVEEVL